MINKKIKKKDEGDSWSGAINKVVNIVLLTALMSIVFGIFATFGGLWVLRMLS